MAQVVKKKNNTVRKWKGQRGGGHHTVITLLAQLYVDLIFERQR